ncbi:hypothetical protein K461DRAFT_314288 [Myriangium duriaei CBS 260.36]|uniref:Uncharacterized protein n=1 Tax=Myriangium duriaei CBS 260.36 TaxID=1168546 RepID=A0A9P4ML72_9PEZI|nr:hypothetical protein K461DRAFT_314288 [Myriangium duriaei CBS 260.36]
MTKLSIATVPGAEGQIDKKMVPAAKGGVRTVSGRPIVVHGFPTLGHSHRLPHHGNPAAPPKNNFTLRCVLWYSTSRTSWAFDSGTPQQADSFHHDGVMGARRWFNQNVLCYTLFAGCFGYGATVFCPTLTVDRYWR